jgi:hypothetical protein
MLLNKWRAPFDWGTMITKKLLNVGRDGASYRYARTFCRFGPPDANHPPDHDSICTFRTANKHAAVSYARAGEMIAQLELEVQELVA